jgi:hypothetical protein
MEPNADQPKAKDDFKSLPLPEICHCKRRATNAGKPA